MSKPELTDMHYSAAKALGAHEDSPLVHKAVGWLKRKEAAAYELGEARGCRKGLEAAAAIVSDLRSDGVTNLCLTAALLDIRAKLAELERGNQTDSEAKPRTERSDQENHAS